jgi:hypothetical protein
MGPVGTWLRDNWLGVLGVVVGVWIPFVLRSPSARLRYWTVPEHLYVSGTAMRTQLNLRNVGSQPIEANQWRVPLSIECPGRHY